MLATSCLLLGGALLLVYVWNAEYELYSDKVACLKDATSILKSPDTVSAAKQLGYMLVDFRSSGLSTMAISPRGTAVAGRKFPWRRPNLLQRQRVVLAVLSIDGEPVAAWSEVEFDTQ